MAEILAIKPAAVDGPVAARLDKGVLRLTLANPPANALSLSVMAALTAELDRARADKAVRVIVLSAAGKVFCAGHDLKEMTARRADADPPWPASGQPADPRASGSFAPGIAAGPRGCTPRRSLNFILSLHGALQTIHRLYSLLLIVTAVIFLKEKAWIAGIHCGSCGRLSFS